MNPSNATKAQFLTDRSHLRAIARALGLEVPPGQDAPTLVGRILNAAHQLRRDHDIMAKRCAEYERTVGRR